MNSKAPLFIIINGPPGSGKDTAMRTIRTFINANPLGDFDDFYPYVDRMSVPIKQAFAGMFNLELDGDLNIIGYEEQASKEKVIPFLGVSCRQWQIDFSEKFMKPLYGNNVFARLFLQRNRGSDLPYQPVCIVPDLGFQVELDSLLFAVGGENILVLQLYRQNYTFAGDSRSYLDVSDGKGGYKCCFVPLINGNISEFHSMIRASVRPFLLGEMPS